MEQKNKLDKNHINCIHYYLNMQENIETKIDCYTKNLQITTEQYLQAEKQLKQFDSKNINYISFGKASLGIIFSFFLAWRLVMWLFITYYIPHSIIVMLYSIMLTGTLVLTNKYLRQSFAEYKSKLEQHVMNYKNTMEQRKKNIDNRIRELHEIQQSLNQLWGNSH